MSHDNTIQESNSTKSRTALTVTEPPKPLNALSALALARTTGCKVRPILAHNGAPVFFYREESGWLIDLGATFADAATISPHWMLDTNNHFRVWEIAPDEGATE